MDAAKAEEAAALEESSREASKSATAARERISRLEAQHSLALRENGKASVRQRALERELARIKSRLAAPPSLLRLLGRVSRKKKAGWKRSLHIVRALYKAL